MQAEQETLNIQKAAKIMLRRNAFELDLKREVVAAHCILRIKEMKNLGP